MVGTQNGKINQILRNNLLVVTEEVNSINNENVNYHLTH